MKTRTTAPSLAHVVLLTLFVSVALTGCEPRDSRYDRPLDVGEAQTLSHHLVWLQPAQKAVSFFQPGTLKFTQVTLEEPPTTLRVAPGGAGAMVLTPSSAVWIPAEKAGVGAHRSYPIGAPFSQIAFSPDGQRAVLHHRPGVSTGAVLTNPNQIAIIDLTAAPSAQNPVARTLKSFGSEPRQIYIGERAEISGSQRQLAWALVDRYLALFDLDAPDAEEVVVHLTLPDDVRDLAPSELAFGLSDGRFTAFTRAERSNEIFSLTFPESAPADQVPRPYLNQLPGGTAPKQLQVLTVEGGLRLFTLNRFSLAVVHPQTGRRIVVETGQDATRMLPFEAARPKADAQAEEAIGHFALLWTEGESTVTFADLDQLEIRRARALSQLRLDGPITALHPLPGRRAAVAQVGDRELVLLDFDDRTAAPLRAEAAIDDLLVDPSGDRFYALMGGEGRSMLVAIDVDTGTPRSVEVLGEGGRLSLVPGSGALVVDFDSEALDLAVIDPLSLEVRYQRGVLLAGVLDP